MKKYIKLITIGFFISVFIFASIFFVTYLTKNFERTESKEESSPYFLLYEPNIERNMPQGVRLTIVDTINSSIGISWFSQRNAIEPMVSYSTQADLLGAINIDANMTYIAPF